MAIALPSIESFQIFGDGKRIILLSKNSDGTELLQLFDDIHMREITVDMTNPEFDFASIGFRGRKPLEPHFPSSVEVTLGMITTGDNYVVAHGKNLLFKTDIFKHMTISDLLKEVNKKVNLRRS